MYMHEYIHAHLNQEKQYLHIYIYIYVYTHMYNMYTSIYIYIYICELYPCTYIISILGASHVASSSSCGAPLPQAPLSALTVSPGARKTGPPEGGRFTLWKKIGKPWEKWWFHGDLMGFYGIHLLVN